MTRLYLLALLSVLIITGCTTEKEDEAPVDRATRSDAASSTSSDPGDVDRPGAQTILVLGNSIAAGYGLDPASAFPSLIQHRIDSLGLDYRVINGGLSGETTAGGLRRLPHLLGNKVDILIIELGGNDGLRGVSTEETRKNLSDMIDLARETYPDIQIILTGMQMPPNLGPEYTTAFREVFPDVAGEKDVELVPFLLEGVGGNAGLNQSDGIHPTAEGQKHVMENVWQTLFPLLKNNPTS